MYASALTVPYTFIVYVCSHSAHVFVLVFIYVYVLAYVFWGVSDYWNSCIVTIQLLSYCIVRCSFARAHCASYYVILT